MTRRTDTKATCLPQRARGFSSPRLEKADRRLATKDRRSSTNLWKQGRLFPDLHPADYEALKESIRVHGVRVPAVVDQQGKIIDGWHRKQACDELKLYCPREVRQFNSNVERMQAAISLNVNRRHISGRQRRELVAKYLRLDPRVNDNQLGEIVGVSKNTVASVRAELEATCQIDKLPTRRGRDGKERPAKYRIIVNTSKEEKKALAALKDLPWVSANKIVDVTTAGRCARRHATQQVIASQAAALLPNDAIRLYHCRFQDFEKSAGIVAGSAKMVCTDIPYGKDFLPEIAELAAFAERVLVPGGLFVTYSGQYYLPQVLETLSKRLTYRWTMASVWNGDAAPIHPLDILSKWKPILIFSKGDWEKRGQWNDLLQCDSKEKEWHAWQQPLGDVEFLVRYFSQPGDLVVDPCGGGFTTAVACNNLGRRFVGCDCDATCVQNGINRLSLNKEVK